MLLLPQDERHLHRALELAEAAVGLASPNPTVGCVLAQGDAVLGEGAHHYDNFDHAEIAALMHASSLGHSVARATAYVTLEPCSHHGRTGPCADALVAARIARCVIATVDPNPQVRGNGIAKLRAAGIEVVIADVASQAAQKARTLNDAFAYGMETGGLPFITLKAALSVDGKLAPAPSQRTTTAPHWLTGEAARADVQALRHAHDAILTGIGTVLADNPSLTDRTGLARRRRLQRAVLDANLRTPLTSQLVTTAADDVTIFCRASAPQAAEQELQAHGVHVHRFSDDQPHLILREVRDVLAAACRSILVEAGSAINGSFLREELVQKVVLYYAETELGLDALPFAEGVASPYVLQQRLTRTSRAAFPNGQGEDIRITGYLHDPWVGV